MVENRFDEYQTKPCLAASTAGRAAAYLRSHDVREIAADLLALARRHPSESLMAAAFTGLLVGRLLFDHSGERPD